MSDYKPLQFWRLGAGGADGGRGRVCLCACVARVGVRVWLCAAGCGVYEWGFAECSRSDTWQTPSLPSVRPGALGKSSIFLFSFFSFFFITYFSKFISMYFENTLSNSLNNIYLIFLRILFHYFIFILLFESLAVQIWVIPKKIHEMQLIN